MPALELDNQRNWKLIIDQEGVAVKSAAGANIAIAAFELITPLTEHILAVRCTSKTAKAHWRFAGNLYQRVSLGLGIPTADATTFKMPLNRVTLVIFPQVSSQYELNFVPVYWLTHLRLTAWKYVG